jgi:D-alanine--poly(phosphoribitol) ligase subunit 2
MAVVATDQNRWLVEWFSQRGNVPGDSLEEQCKLNFFEAGLIDSFGVIELIMAVEEQFGVKFDELHFQDRRFATIEGLSEIISEIKKS